MAKSLKYLNGFVHPDGGIYSDGSTHQNYETCVAMQCFSEANRDHRYDTLLKKAEAYVKGLQWDDSEGHDKSSVNYGGAGYGSSKRPDLSNTSFLLDALKSVGRTADDEAVKKALVFVSRCQNLETRIQHHAVCRQERRRRFLLHARRRRFESGRQDATTAGCAATAR